MTNHAVVTGVSRGIGVEVARSLLDAGFRVEGLARTESSAVRDLGTEYPKFMFHQIDLSDRASILRLSKQFIESGSPFSIVVNCAGQAQRKPLEELTAEDWQLMFEVNLFSAVELTRLLLPKLLEVKSSLVVNLGSISGSNGGKLQVHYAASKAALANFTKSLNNLYSVHGLRAFLLEVGQVDTEMMTPEITDRGLESVIATIPVGRLGHAAEVAEFVRLLATEAPEFLGGQTIRINGGSFYGG